MIFDLVSQAELLKALDYSPKEQAILDTITHAQLGDATIPLGAPIEKWTTMHGICEQVEEFTEDLGLIYYLASKDGSVAFVNRLASRITGRLY